MVTCLARIRSPTLQPSTGGPPSLLALLPWPLVPLFPYFPIHVHFQSFLPWLSVHHPVQSPIQFQFPFQFPFQRLTTLCSLVARASPQPVEYFQWLPGCRFR